MLFPLVVPRRRSGEKLALLMFSSPELLQVLLLLVSRWPPPPPAAPMSRVSPASPPPLISRSRFFAVPVAIRLGVVSNTLASALCCAATISRREDEEFGKRFRSSSMRPSKLTSVPAHDVEEQGTDAIERSAARGDDPPCLCLSEWYTECPARLCLPKRSRHSPASKPCALQLRLREARALLASS